MGWENFLTIGHIIGTVLGVGGATFAEIFYIKSAKDGKIDPYESDTLRTVYFVLRLGLIILVISGFGFLLSTRLEGQSIYLYSPRTWAKLTITLLIAINAILLQVRKMPIFLGGPISLTSWYAALIIGAWRMRASFVEIMSIFVLAVILVTVILGLIKVYLHQKQKI